MKFRKGDYVEVMRREHEPQGSWFPGNIISVHSSGYVVRYRLLVDREGKGVVEKVYEEDVRPVPPHAKSKRWMVGEIAEVFDGCCWRVGKIAKVLKNNRFVIRLFGSIQLKEFHESDLRIWKAWRGRNWPEITKIAQNKPTQTSIRVKRDDSCTRGEDGWKQLKDGLDHPKMQYPERTIAYPFKLASKDLLIRGSLKKRKSSPRSKGCDRPLRRSIPLSKQVEDVADLGHNFSRGSSVLDSKREKETTDRLNTCRPLWSTADSNQCSVASCSSNDFAVCPGENSMKSSNRISDSSDAESSVPSTCKRDLPPSPICKLEADIHRLELHAYKSTMQALYASGPLSWEQESLLTNLRLSLHISDDEHLIHLRHLLSAQVL